MRYTHIYIYIYMEYSIRLNGNNLRGFTTMYNYPRLSKEWLNLPFVLFHPRIAFRIANDRSNGPPRLMTGTEPCV